LYWDDPARPEPSLFARLLEPEVSVDDRAEEEGEETPVDKVAEYGPVYEAGEERERELEVGRCRTDWLLRHCSDN